MGTPISASNAQIMGFPSPFNNQERDTSIERPAMDLENSIRVTTTTRRDHERMAPMIKYKRACGTDGAPG